MLRLHVTPRIARALRALIACLVLGVAAAPTRAAFDADRVVVVNVQGEQASDLPRHEVRAPRSSPREPFASDASSDACEPSLPGHEACVRARVVALYLSHCALLL